MEHTRMNKDFGIALSLISVFAIMLATRTKFPIVLEGYMYKTRPVASIVILGMVAALYLYNLKVSSLVAGLLSIYLLKTLWSNWPRSDARRLHLDIQKDQVRFDPAISIDLQFATGAVKHNLPVLLQKPYFPEMLVFPPSSETQLEMNGE
jgi:hypothetical protein